MGYLSLGILNLLIGDNKSKINFKIYNHILNIDLQINKPLIKTTENPLSLK